jgi:folate-binding Fe-S cluster repair protein YgfZ
MSTKPNTNLKAIELTQAELASVTGGDRVAYLTKSQIAKIHKLIKEGKFYDTGGGYA